MRVLVLGGTGFVGRHVVARLLAAGDEVLVAHRGPAEPADFPDVPHLHVDRASFAGTGSFEPDAVVDCCAETGRRRGRRAPAPAGRRAPGRAVQPGRLPRVRAGAGRGGRGAGAGRRGLAAASGTASAPGPRVRVRRLRQARRGAGDARPAPGPCSGSRWSTASTTRSGGRRWCCAGSGPDGRGSRSAPAAGCGPACTPATRPRRSSSRCVRDAARGAVLNLGEAEDQLDRRLDAARCSPPPATTPSWSPSPDAARARRPPLHPRPVPAPAHQLPPGRDLLGWRPADPLGRSAARSVATSPTDPRTPTRLHPRPAPGPRRAAGEAIHARRRR